MKGIRHIAVTAAVAGLLGLGLVSAAQAHVFVGVGIGPVAPVVPVMPVAALPVYPPPPVYYAPPPPVYVAPPVVVGAYWGHPHYYPHYYPRYYGYGYWR
ncbi:hypothetical protein [Burkholderia sp. Ac-20365]|uniref:hypothetical protein n=1 Tax=Burkholderia sp. Ac-20365 TaxID=2703897 RepID=UPI00197B1F19|nr:hypothetical protein [Burkholderia sp. Ac-20365]MBN3764950.1 hypothetical protein [Burkholderia sp. Ac-20365]